jgi:hypothetical protein
MKNELGSTGQFPDGKIDENDEGELRLSIEADSLTNQIIIDFGEPVTWVSLSPEEAIDFAEFITKKAKELQEQV